MSYRLINANDLNGKISDKDYELVLNAPCIYADLPNGLDNEYHEIPGWIPVSERLPETGKQYLCCNADGFREVGYLSKRTGEWAFTDTEAFGEVIAWMPLPEPYKGGE